MTSARDDRAPAETVIETPPAASAEPQLVEGDCTVPLSPDVNASAWPEPVQALAHVPGSGVRPTTQVTA